MAFCILLPRVSTKAASQTLFSPKFPLKVNDVEQIPNCRINMKNEIEPKFESCKIWLDKLTKAFQEEVIQIMKYKIKTKSDELLRRRSLKNVLQIDFNKDFVTRNSK